MKTIFFALPMLVGCIHAGGGSPGAPARTMVRELALGATSYTVTYVCPANIQDAISYHFSPVSAGTIRGAVDACATRVGSDPVCSSSSATISGVTGTTTLASVTQTLLTQWQTDHCK